MKLKEFNKLKPGDKVRIVSEKTGELWNPAGFMDKWLGKVMTVRENLGNIVLMEEDIKEYDAGWRWYPEMIDCVVDKNNASDASAICPAIEIISEHIHAIINVLTDLANQLDEITRSNHERTCICT